ncbi:ABC transporter substrate-binding protein [Frondihabitans australicus]|uniref:Carbohydrate ABC transporter substrate-binding protein (CUT1 family) n=1 Tax=Frondihabitans australicus TaxID=386892 RepID=A0A495IBW9_9MICO|nr:sugar ABC transporter substrate-binding protein [Frondihabitans australicus]RKR73503.1 carbohydrate ABC transporter substrate-binding protein (CUT1 family) [Frondihabitans australicus]
MPGHDSETPGVSRRTVLKYAASAAGLAALAPALAACSTSTGASAGTAAVTKSTKADLVLTTWNIPADVVAYRKFAAEYKKMYPGVNIKVQVTPNGDFNQYMSTQLAGGNAPDIIRNTWQGFGRWAQNGGFVALDDYLKKGYGDGFGETFWKAAQVDGKVHGIPQHTDTFGTYYRKDVMAKVGAKIPTTIDDAWTWDQFLSLAKDVKQETGKAAVAYGFEGANTAYRWLPFLYMHGGKLLEDDGKTPAIDNATGIEAIAWFQNLYNEGLIPKSNTIKGSTTAAVENLFTSGQVGLMIWGDWIMGEVAKGFSTDKWDITYMPQDKSRASDLGGNLLSVSKSSKSPAVAADFIQFVCNEANMKYFCETDLFLPVRTALQDETLTFSSQSKQMALFSEQAKTVPAAMAKVETLPDFATINEVLADQLDLCFIGSQTPTATAKAIASGIQNAAS